DRQRRSVERSPTARSRKSVTPSPTTAEAAAATEVASVLSRGRPESLCWGVLGKGCIFGRGACVGLLAAAAGLSAPAGAGTIRDDVAAAAGGLAAYFDSADAWPATVYLTMGCSGTLIDARTVVTAGHCFGTQADADATGAGTAAAFGPYSDPATDIGAASVLVHPEYDPDVFAVRDVAIIALSQPVTDVAPVPLARVVTASGQEVVFGGYGLALLASRPDGDEMDSSEVLNDYRRRI